MEEVIYSLPSHVRVRKESFGLLFYNSKDTNLTFINSKDLISPDDLEQEHNEKFFYHHDAKGNGRTKQILERLKERGLIIEKRVFI